jgi:hypothetical protein
MKPFERKTMQSLAEAYQNRRNVWMIQKMYGESIADESQPSRLIPQNTGVYFNRVCSRWYISDNNGCCYNAGAL